MVKTHRWPINKDIKVEYDFLELIYKPQIFSYTFVSSKKVGNQVTSEHKLPSLAEVLRVG